MGVVFVSVLALFVKKFLQRKSSRYTGSDEVHSINERRIFLCYAEAESEWVSGHTLILQLFSQGKYNMKKEILQDVWYEN